MKCKCWVPIHQTKGTHIDFEVFGSRVDAPSGGVVARQVVQGHVSYPDGMWQRNDKSALDPVERPTFPWQQDWVTLLEKETELVELHRLIFACLIS